MSPGARLTREKRFILNFTPTGMIPTREMTPHVPVTPAEIVDQVLSVTELGVGMVHLHARHPVSGKPHYGKEIYARIIGGIREKNENLILCVSTSGRTYSAFAHRSECLELKGDLKPDFGSLTLSSLNFNRQASVSEPQMIKDLARKMLNNGIRPELEVFDVGMINFGRYLIRKGLVKHPFYFNLILGNIACAQADLMHLGVMIRDLPDGSLWSVGGVGAAQLPMNIISVIAGGGVRVGLEDNIWFDTERTRLATNYELVERVVTIAAAMGARPYSPKECRQVLNL